jgi:hypothetical protein
MALTANCSGWYATYCAVVLDGGGCTRGDCWGNGTYGVVGALVRTPSGGEKDTGGGMLTGAGTGMATTPGGRKALGVCALDHSSSESLDSVAASAVPGGAYNADALNDGGRGRGA